LGGSFISKISSIEYVVWKRELPGKSFQSPLDAHTGGCACIYIVRSYLPYFWYTNETERHRDRETERQRDKETKRQRDKETKRQRDRKTERQRDRETERQKDRETEIDRDTFGTPLS
jgi:hypothetical protein